MRSYKIPSFKNLLIIFTIFITILINKTSQQQQEGDSFFQILNRQEYQYSSSSSSSSLEEKQIPSPSLTDPNSPLLSDIKSLTMGKILSSVNINVCSIILSKDNKTAFAAIKYIGSLKIIDISDYQYPRIIGTLTLSPTGYFFKVKSLFLSPDEKTLFASTTQILEIINISDLTAPVLLSTFKDPSLGSEGELYDFLPDYYIPSLAISGDSQILFIGGIGLQIFNVKDLSKPTPTLSKRSPLRNGKFYGTGVAMLPDGKTFIFANQTLDIYNITAATLTLIKSYKTQGLASSVYVSKQDNHTIYVSSLENKTHQAVLEKIDLSSVLSPVILEALHIPLPCSYYPFIQAVSAQEETFFLMMSEQEYGHNLVTFSRAQRKVLDNTNSLVSNALAVALSVDSQYAFSSANDQFRIIRLFKDYPNSKIFSHWNNSVETYEHSSKIIYAEASKSQEIIYMGTPKSFDIVNISSQKTISSYPLQEELTSFQLSHDEKLVYIQQENALQILNITDLYSPSLHGNFSLPNNKVEKFVCSPKGDVAFLLRRISSSLYRISVIDFSDLKSVTETPITNTTSEYYLHKIVPSPDGNLLYYLNANITIYNITNRTQPELLLSIPITSEDPDPGVVSCKISPDSTIMYLQTMDQNYYFRFRILNITNLTSIQTMSVLLLPKLTEKSLIQPLQFSSDLKKAYLIVQKDIMALDISNKSSPVILGVTPGLSEQDLRVFMISADNKNLYLTNLENQMLIINIETKYSLYINQERFLVGKKYSDFLMFLKLDQESNYQLINHSEYKVIKLFLSDLQVLPSQYTTELIPTSLPYWMTFDKDKLVLTVESKKLYDIGSYTLSSFLSNKIPLDAFENLNITTKSEDIITLLITLGYIDNQRFLTVNFGTFDDFILGSQYNSTKKSQIYQILKRYLVQTFTTFEVIASLDLVYLENKVHITTASTKEIKIDIKLPDNHTQFLHKPYATSLLPVITEKKTRLTIEGSLKEINIALGEIIIDLELENNLTSCPAIITINDNLNPSITKALQNASQYFKINQPPRVNADTIKTIQEQIDATSYFTGQYFAINLNESSFIDDYYPEGLTYELVLDSTEKNLLPNWLTFNNLGLKGTPPEEYFGREIHLILIAKNEFKRVKVPITLKIKISTMFAMKLVLRYCPYILTLIGLLVGANKIYNILAKKWYKHPKEFYLQIGEEITSQMIFPIRFVVDEQAEIQIILKNLQAYLIKNHGLRSTTHDSIVNYFLDGETELDEAKVFMAIRMTVDEMKEAEKEKLRLYRPGINSRKDFIEQAIFHQFVLWQLESKQEKATRMTFDRIKDKWADIIEYNDLKNSFVLNKMKFDGLVKPVKMNESTQTASSQSDPRVSLLFKETGANINLLEKALIIHATRLHYVKIRDIMAHIFVKERMESNIISRFFKLNEIPVSYSEKGKAGYGIEYKIENDVLSFFGSTHKNFDGKTLVVQIMSPHQKIIKEIWIHGVSDKLDRKTGEVKDLLKSGYEVF